MLLKATFLHQNCPVVYFNVQLFSGIVMLMIFLMVCCWLEISDYQSFQSCSKKQVTHWTGHHHIVGITRREKESHSHLDSQFRIAC